ncbi:hypothetical protein BD560DRAFT_445135 [Blakeslea trispora]|nr:hypothetical protein BD560DRAFT_445134 [Blakeslea trispora]KAI8378628.1 hypothetical protein BD560DRAFT_445135 [Blakeslea trispora]
MSQNLTNITKREVDQLLKAVARRDNDSRSLKQVLLENAVVYHYKLKSSSFADFKAKLTTKYRRVLSKMDPNFDANLLLSPSMQDWKVAYFCADEARINHPRSELVAWYYKEALGSDDLQDYKNEISSIVSEVEGHEASTLEGHLNKLSVVLLKKFANLTNIEMGALKLCLSSTISLISPAYKDFFMENIPLDNYVDLNENETSHVGQEETAKIEAAFEETKQLLLKLPKRILLNNEGTIEEQVQDIMLYIYKSLPIWQKTTITSEAFYVKIIDSILNIVFSDTSLQIVSGETCSDATKTVRAANENLYESVTAARSATTTTTTTTKGLCGRKIDLLLATDKEIEVAAFEFKKKSSSSKDSIYQESKSIRINASIEKVLSSFNETIDKQMGMDWCGVYGYTYVIKKVGRVFVASKVREMKLPMTRDELYSEETKELILSLYDLKGFFVEYGVKLPNNLEKNMINAVQFDDLPTIVHSPRIKHNSFAG